MDQIILVCGNWKEERNKWVFKVDNSHGWKIVGVGEDVSFDEFLKIVYEDFGINHEIYEVNLSYVPKGLMQFLPQHTPLIIVNNTKQLGGVLQQFWREATRMCVEILWRSTVGIRQSEVGGRCEGKCEATFGELSQKFGRLSLNNIKKEAGHVEEDDDAEFRFDYCEDVDGASSSDEEFISLRRKVEEEENINLSYQKKELGNDDYLGIEIRSLQLAVGQVYSSKDEVETRLKILSVIQRFDFDVVSSSLILLVVQCWVPNCKLRVRGLRIDESPCFHIQKYCQVHTCSITEKLAGARQATLDVLGHLYLDFVGGVEHFVLPCHVAEALNKHFGIKMKYWKTHRTLKQARSLCIGSSENSFEELTSYLYMFRHANPGTLIKLEVDQDDKFRFLFNASIRGFPYMCKVVVMDGTFLQGKYKGTILTATMQDGNFNIFPTTFSVVDTENNESWEWFFRQLNRVIPDDEELAIISDRHRSIGKAIAKVYPLAARGICTYHLRKKFLAKFRRGESFKLFKKAATAYRIEEFNLIFAKIERLNPRLHVYLRRVDVKMWS